MIKHTNRKLQLFEIINSYNQNSDQKRVNIFYNKMFLIYYAHSEKALTLSILFLRFLSGNFLFFYLKIKEIREFF
jgi:hypothetical protein